MFLFKFSNLYLFFLFESFLQKNLKTLYAEIIKLPIKFYKMVLKIKEWNKQEEKRGGQEHKAN